MKALMEALNHPIDAYRRGNKRIAWGMVIITVCLNVIPELFFLEIQNGGTVKFDPVRTGEVIGFGVLTYAVFCFLFFIVCKAFGSKTTFMQHFSAWGISYAPTAICAIVVAATETFYYVFWNRPVFGMLLNLVFFAILIWKAVLYFIYIREFAGLKGWKFWCVAVIMGVFIMILAALDGYLGVKTPML